MEKPGPGSRTQRTAAGRHAAASQDGGREKVDPVAARHLLDVGASTAGLFQIMSPHSSPARPRRRAFLNDAGPESLPRGRSLRPGRTGQGLGHRTLVRRCTRQRGSPLRTASPRGFHRDGDADLGEHRVLLAGPARAEMTAATPALYRRRCGGRRPGKRTPAPSARAGAVPVDGVQGHWRSPPWSRTFFRKGFHAGAVVELLPRPLLSPVAWRHMPPARASRRRGGTSGPRGRRGPRPGGIDGLLDLEEVPGPSQGLVHVRDRAARRSGPGSLPVRTRESASASRAPRVFMNAPAPHLTSNTRACAPSANFFDMMLAVMSGIDSTVPVTSRSAYIVRSAGTIVSLCRSWRSPPRRRAARSAPPKVHAVAADGLELVQRPARVAQRPAAHHRDPTPQAAATGARTREILSPTPPVECLSTSGPGTPERSSTSPDAIIARVRPRSPRRHALEHMAMRRAENW